MGIFFAELAKKLAERWLTLLLLPGALVIAAAAIGPRLGHRHALDGARLQDAVSAVATAVGRQPAGSQALLAIAALLGATATGLIVQALAGLTRGLWLGTWPRILALPRRWRAGRRRARWHRRLGRRRALEQAHPRESRTPDQQEAVNAAADRVNRISWTEPRRPTWMGDRVGSLERIALDRSGLDLAFAWPRLWLTLPGTARDEITAAHAAFAAAVATGTWAWPWLVLGGFWWPSGLAGIAVGATGWFRARAAVADLTTLTEAALDLHGRALATALGVATPDGRGPLTIAEGERISALIRKGR